MTELVTVCDACGTEACWKGEYMCLDAKRAGTKVAIVNKDKAVKSDVTRKKADQQALRARIDELYYIKSVPRDSIIGTIAEQIDKYEKELEQ